MWICGNCQSTFDAMTQDGCCDKIQCFGEPLMPVNGASAQANQSNSSSAPSPSSSSSGGLIEGLCVLVCDISGSMDQAAFANHPAEKLKLVTGAIHKAIAELESLAKADTAYIAIIAFGERAGLIKDSLGRPFVKSVSDIVDEFGEYAARLPEYLYSYFKDDKAKVGRGGTDITAALKLARSIYDGTLAGDLTSFGVGASPRLMEHSDIVTQHGNVITMPNIRVMIYSDGAHGGGRLVNAFDGLSPSPLMTAFIGDDQDAGSRLGADQMRDLANDCPEHGQKGYFLINSPERHAVLRNLFRMASGASGFCPQCLRRQSEQFSSHAES